MQIIKNCKYANFIYYIAIFIHIMIMCVEFGQWSVPYRGRLLQVAFLLCCIKIIMTFYTKIQWIAMTILGVMGIVSYYFTREKYVLYVMVLIWAAKSVDIDKVLKYILYASVAAIFVISILSLLGVGGPAFDARDYGRNAIEVRYGLGFSHANNFHSAIWLVATLAVWIYKDKFDWKHYCIMTVVNILLFLLTASKTGLIATELIIVAGVLYRYANKAIFESIWIYIAGAVVYVVILGFSLAAITICGWRGYGPVLDFVNRLTTGRVHLAYKYARLEWWKIWSKSGVEETILDNGFASLGISFGYVICITFIIFVAYMLYIAAKKKDGILFAIIVISIICTYMENTFVLNYAYLLCNPIYLVAMKVLCEDTFGLEVR